MRVGVGTGDPTASAQIREEEGARQATLTGRGPWSIQRDPARGGLEDKVEGTSGRRKWVLEVETQLHL